MKRRTKAVSELMAEGVLPESVEVRASKYLNNLIEQDHRRVKRAVLADARVQEFQQRSSDAERD
jgi:transposase-like protein